MARIDPEKNREYQRKWYLKNRELQCERNKLNKKRKADWYKNYKSTLSCEICGENHPATLDFHHKDKDDKLEQLSTLVNRNWGFDKIKKEIQKCQVLCSNCHRKLHYEEKINQIK